jgi:hypothetical protein
VTVFIRIALAWLFLNELVVGFWNQAFPESFYVNFPTVDLTPPFSEHYARDFGGATLGIALLLGIALVKPRAVFVIPAVLAYLAFAVPHFFFHLNHLEHATSGQAVLLTTANAFVVLLGIAVVLLTAARDRRTKLEPGAEQGSDKVVSPYQGRP